MEVLQKINDYLQLMKPAKPTSYPQHSHKRLENHLSLKLKRLHVALHAAALYLHECH